jgi:CheY-like chemotaxis protein
MHILFVEDEPKIANFVQVGLKEQGFVVDYYDNGNDGYEQAIAHEYDAIVLDIMVPGKDGLSILKHLRRLGRNRLPANSPATAIARTNPYPHVRRSARPRPLQVWRSVADFLPREMNTDTALLGIDAEGKTFYQSPIGLRTLRLPIYREK